MAVPKKTAPRKSPANRSTRRRTKAPTPAAVQALQEVHGFDVEAARERAAVKADALEEVPPRFWLDAHNNPIDENGQQLGAFNVQVAKRRAWEKANPDKAESEA